MTISQSNWVARAGRLLGASTAGSVKSKSSSTYRSPQAIVIRRTRDRSSIMPLIPATSARSRAEQALEALRDAKAKLDHELATRDIMKLDGGVKSNGLVQPPLNLRRSRAECRLIEVIF